MNTLLPKIVMKLFATFDFRRIDKAVVKSIQNNNTLFHRKMFFLCIKQFWIALQVKHFLSK